MDHNISPELVGTTVLARSITEYHGAPRPPLTPPRARQEFLELTLKPEPQDSMIPMADDIDEQLEALIRRTFEEIADERRT